MTFIPATLRRMALLSTAVLATSPLATAADAPPGNGAAESRAVSVIGLGNMGATLAKTFVEHHLKVTVWNRTASKAAPLVAAGATLAKSPAAAIAASPLTVICTTDKSILASLLNSADVTKALRGRILADLSTGTPASARANAEGVKVAGARYIDGGILLYPRDIGKADSLIVYSGDAAAFREQEDTLAILAGGQHFIGEDPSAAATVYLGLWAYYFPALAGFFEGAALAQTAGVKLDEFQKLAAFMTRKLDDGIDDATTRIAKHDYAGDQAPVQVYTDGLYLMRDTFRAQHLNHAAVDAFIDYLEQAERAGEGSKDIAVLFRMAGGRD